MVKAQEIRATPKKVVVGARDSGCHSEQLVAGQTELREDNLEVYMRTS